MTAENSYGTNILAGGSEIWSRSILERMSDVGCCIGEDTWGSPTQKSLIKAYEKLSPKAQRSVVELLLNTQGVMWKVEGALKRAINDPKLIKKYVQGADFVEEAIKKALREDSHFAISLHEALRGEKAASYGLKFDYYLETIQFTKPKLSKKPSLPTGR